MPWYVVIRNPMNRHILGFLTDGDQDTPQSWDTEEKAKEDMKGHLCEHSCDYIELD